MFFWKTNAKYAKLHKSKLLSMKNKYIAKIRCIGYTYTINFYWVGLFIGICGSNCYRLSFGMYKYGLAYFKKQGR